MDAAIGVDIGGTSIKAARVSAAGEVLDRCRATTPVAAGRGAIEAEIAGLVGRLSRGPIAGVGVGLPGFLLLPEGVVVKSPNIPCLAGYDARVRLAAQLGVPVAVGNDANLAALGEGWVGAGRGIPHLLMVTLGTGIGSGVLLGGRIWHGDRGRAAEFGHLVVRPGGAACGCGGRGCVEAYASATALRRLAGERGLAGDVPELLRLAEQGLAPAQAVFAEAGAALGLALADWLNLMDVRTVIVGGGAAPALEAMLPSLREAIEENVYGVRASEVRILRAALGEDAGVIGAARLAMTAG